MKKLSFLFLLMLFVGFTASAQMRITGTVTNAATGDPIPGVSVVVQGQTTVGTSTDMDGQYELQVPSDAESLVFSFVGMERLVEPIQDRSVIDVALQPSVEEMEEVVVTAIGISKERKALGYSAQGVGGDELSKTGE